MTHRKIIIAAVAAFTTIGGTAYAAGGELAFTTASTATNPHTCKFLQKEVDPKTGPTWKNLRTYSLYEDARHDAKMACLAKRHPILIYKTVTVVGTGQTVTASCPVGLDVTGGGSRSETTGSYPNGNGWTVARDRLSPKRLDVTAICVGVTQ